MKKILVLALGLMMVASVSLAADAQKTIEVGINGGIALPTSSGYDLGFGGQVTGLYRVSENLGVGLGIGYDTFTLTGLSGYSTSDLSFLATLKYAIGTDKTKPYILVDAGLSSFSVSYSGLSASTSNPEIGGGVGVQFPAGDAMNIFLQGTANVVLGNGGTFTYIPVDLGVNFDM